MPPMSLSASTAMFDRRDPGACVSIVGAPGGLGQSQYQSRLALHNRKARVKLKHLYTT
jgi:hypothetical protein